MKITIEDLQGATAYASGSGGSLDYRDMAAYINATLRGVLESEKRPGGTLSRDNGIVIKGEHDDMIYPVREFISRLGKVCDREFDELYEKLVADGFPDDESTKDWLFDYIWNSDPETDPFTFEEFCDWEYKREFWRKEKISKAAKKDSP